MSANIADAPPPPPEPPQLGKDSDNAKVIRKALELIELNQKWSTDLYDWANDVYAWSQSINAWRQELSTERRLSTKRTHSEAEDFANQTALETDAKARELAPVAVSEVVVSEVVAAPEESPKPNAKLAAPKAKRGRPRKNAQTA